MPLSMIQPGQTSSIKRILGNDHTRQHLNNLGLVVGENVTVISKLSGNIILNIKGTRIALDRSMANRIMI